MKSLFTLLLLATGMLAKSTPNSVEPTAVKAFEATYGKNANASWSCTAKGCEVAFEHKGQYITAVYTHGGHLRWYKKHIASTQLPVTLQLGLKKHFSKFWIADIEEKSGSNGASYFLTLENGYKKITLLATGGNWQIVQSINKA